MEKKKQGQFFSVLTARTNTVYYANVRYLTTPLITSKIACPLYPLFKDTVTAFKSHKPMPKNILKHF